MYRSEKRINYSSFEPIRVAVEYLSSCLYNDCTVMDHEVDIFAINLSNRIIDEIYETKVLKKEFFGKPDRSFDDCNCYRGYELILEVNVSNRLSKLICESAEHFSLSIAEIAEILPHNFNIAIGRNFCLRVDETMIPIWMFKAPECHFGGKVCDLNMSPVLRLTWDHVTRPKFKLITELEKNSSPVDYSSSSDNTHTEIPESVPISPIIFQQPVYDLQPEMLMGVNAHLNLTRLQPDLLRRRSARKVKRRNFPEMTHSETSLMRFQHTTRDMAHHLNSSRYEPNIGALFKELVIANIQKANSHTDIH